MFPRFYSYLPEPCLEDFRFEQKLGSGTYGTVSKYFHRKTNLPYAIKEMKIKGTDEKELLMFKKEVEVLYKIRHRLIVRLIDHFLDSKYENLFLIMEFVEGSDLSKSILKKKVQLPTEEIAAIVAQVAEALAELHKHHIIHRDLKLENVIYLPNKSIKLVDLGCSNYFGDNIQRLTSVGTKIYYSPELLRGDGQDDKLDVWCLGVLMYELLFLKSPFMGADMIVQIQKLEYEIPRTEPHYTEELADLIRKIFVYKMVRISAKQVLQHPWIKENNSLTSKAESQQRLEDIVIDKEEMKNYKRFLLEKISECERDIQNYQNQNQALLEKVEWCRQKLEGKPSF